MGPMDKKLAKLELGYESKRLESCPSVLEIHKNLFDCFLKILENYCKSDVFGIIFEIIFRKKNLWVGLA